MIFFGFNEFIIFIKGDKKLDHYILPYSFLEIATKYFELLLIVGV